MTDYITQTWEDLPTQTTPLEAVRLRHMEDGIFGAIRKTNNLLDLTDITIARTNLGLGALATKNTIGPADIADGSLVAADFAVDPYARANHTGTQLAATIFDFDTAVRANRLDQMALPAASVNLGGQSLTNVGAPVNPGDAVTKSYADALAPAGGGGIPPATFNANTILKADVDDTPVALTVPASTFVGRSAAGSIAALTAAQAKTILAITNTDVTGLGGLATKTTIVDADIAVGAAIVLSKLAVDPLARANHTGTQLAVTISDFNTAVRLNRLDQMAQPTSPVNVGGQTVTNSGSPTLASDLTNKAYVDNVAAGLDFKSSVKACATTNVTIASPGATIDGVTMTSGNRVLLAGQTTPSENGIYVWNGAAAAMTRASDADADAEVTSGMYVFVEGGTANGAKAFVLVTPDPIVLGTTALTFTLFSGGGTSVVGTANRITVTGTQIDISAAYTGQSSITTLGTITTGVWNGTPIPIANGGTGATTAAGARTALGILGKQEFLCAAATVTTCTHNVGSTTVGCEVYEASTGKTVLADVQRTTVNALTVTFQTAPTAGQYKIVVWG